MKWTVWLYPSSTELSGSYGRTVWSSSGHKRPVKRVFYEEKEYNAYMLALKDSNANVETIQFKENE